MSKAGLKCCVNKANVDQCWNARLYSGNITVILETNVCTLKQRMRRLSSVLFVVSGCHVLGSGGVEAKEAPVPNITITTTGAARF
jgi:hypothetical protein